MDSLRFLAKSSKMLMKGHMQYLGSFFWHTAATAVMTLSEFLAVVLLMNRFSHLNQWNANDIMLFFGVMQCAFALTEFLCRGIGHFDVLVQSGQFDTMLLRPRPALLQVMGAELDPRRLGTILIGLLAIVLASTASALTWTIPKLLCLVWSILGTVALCAGLFLIEAICCFFSVKSIEAINILTYGGKTTCQYPIDIYPQPLQLLFLFVAPFALTTHVPVSYILDKPLWSANALAAFLAPLAGFLFFFIMTFFWKLGLRKYRSTGS